jgi:methyl-accepting chemotaxis protein
MKAFQPSDAAWQAAGSAADNWGESQTETIASIGETMTSMRQEMTKFLPVLQRSITDIVDGMMDSLLPILGALDGADPKALSAVATIISSTINGVSSMFGVLGPAIQAAQERASAENASPDAFGSTLDHIKRMMEAIGPTIGKMREPLKTLVNNVIQIAKGIEDPRRLGPKIEVLSAAIDAVSSITRALSPGGALARLTNVGDQDLSATINNVSSAVQTLRRSNVIEQMVGLINTVPRNIESRLETIASIGQHVSTLTQSLSNIELDSIVALNESLSGDGRLSITHDNVNVTLTVRVNMSARDIGRGVLEVNRSGDPFGNGGQRFQTE